MDKYFEKKYGINSAVYAQIAADLVQMIAVDLVSQSGGSELEDKGNE